MIMSNGWYSHKCLECNETFSKIGKSPGLCRECLQKEDEQLKTELACVATDYAEARDRVEELEKLIEDWKKESGENYDAFLAMYKHNVELQTENKRLKLKSVELEDWYKQQLSERR